VFHDRGGELFVDELPLATIADRFPTPFYVYSATALRAAYRALAGALPDGTEVLFSIKANSNPHIAVVFRELGAGAEVASLGELAIARRAGFAPANVAFAGPGKSRDELDAAVEAGLGCVNVESVAEARRLSALASERQRDCTVCLRINPRTRNPEARQQMGGHAVPFGVDEEQAAAALADIDRLPRVQLAGIHLYVGTQVLDAAAAASTIATAVDMTALFEQALGRPPGLVAIGPGLGVPLFAGEQPLDLDRFRTEAHAAIARRPAGSRITIEAGRFLCAEAGAYIATVLDLKESRGQRFAVLDGGLHHHAAAAGSFGNFFRKAFPIRTVRATSSSPVPVTLVGPCCTPLDRLVERLPLGDLSIGDRVAVLASGAYGYSASPLLFLSHAAPAELLVDGTHVAQIRAPFATANLFVD